MKDYLLSLIERRTVAKGTMLFSFDISGTDFAFDAGQYCDFTVIDPPKTDDEGNTRAFSLVSSPNDKQKISITTRLRQTAFKQYLHDMPLGTKVKVFGPMGNFTLPDDTSRPLVFIAGGIGITPQHAMLLYATEQRTGHTIHLFAANRTKAQIPFYDELNELAAKNPNLMLTFTLSDETQAQAGFEIGHIDEAMLKRHLTDVLAPKYYISGPPDMVNALKAIVRTLGVGKDNILTEDFAGY